MNAYTIEYNSGRTCIVWADNPAVAQGLAEETCPNDESVWDVRPFHEEEEGITLS